MMDDEEVSGAERHVMPVVLSSLVSFTPVLNWVIF